MINKNFLNTFGPGILFAGAAIGTSHLVQSTRAGADFGLGLLVLVIFANFLKYPFFRFGPLYTVATGNSILQGYRDLGRWAIVALILTEFPVNIIIIAATSLVTSSIVLSVFDLGISAVYLSVILVIVAFCLVSFGGYKFLDRCTKLFVAILTICTFLATAMTFPSVEWGLASFSLPDIDLKTLVFVIALLGFMPAGLSLSIMHSVWSVEKAKITGYRATKSEAMLDLNIGYIGSAILAVCFIIMGAGTLYGNGITMSASAGGFAGQVISLYTTTLGAWAGGIVAVSVFAVMISTLLSIMDGFARLHGEAINQYMTDIDVEENNLSNRTLHIPLMAALGLGAILVLLLFMTNFKEFIDFVTIISFVVGPVIAILNHIVIHGKNVPKQMRPSLIVTIWSCAGVLFLLVLSAVYFVPDILGLG